MEADDGKERGEDRARDLLSHLDTDLWKSKMEKMLRATEAEEEANPQRRSGFQAGSASVAVRKPNAALSNGRLMAKHSSGLNIMSNTYHRFLDRDKPPKHGGMDRRYKSEDGAQEQDRLRRNPPARPPPVRQSSRRNEHDPGRRSETRQRPRSGKLHLEKNSKPHHFASKHAEKGQAIELKQDRDVNGIKLARTKSSPFENNASSISPAETGSPTFRTKWLRNASAILTRLSTNCKDHGQASVTKDEVDALYTMFLKLTEIKVLALVERVNSLPESCGEDIKQFLLQEFSEAEALSESLLRQGSSGSMSSGGASTTGHKTLDPRWSSRGSDLSVGLHGIKTVDELGTFPFASRRLRSAHTDVSYLWQKSGTPISPLSIDMTLSMARSAALGKSSFSRDEGADSDGQVRHPSSSRMQRHKSSFAAFNHTARSNTVAARNHGYLGENISKSSGMETGTQEEEEEDDEDDVLEVISTDMLDDLTTRVDSVKNTPTQPLPSPASSMSSIISTTATPRSVVHQDYEADSEHDASQGSYDSDYAKDLQYRVDMLCRLLMDIDEWGFDVFQVSDLSTQGPLVVVCFAVFERHGFLSTFSIDASKVQNLLVAAQSKYPNNPYHNALHAADVTQTMSHLFIRCGLHVYADDLHRFAAVFSALMHDIRHPGVTNTFLIETSHPLAIRYNDKSPLEMMHASTAFELLRKPQNDILESIDKESRKLFRHLCICMILATDNAEHNNLIFRLESWLESLNDSFGEEDRQGITRKLAEDQSILTPEDHLLVLQVHLHAADISSSAKPWKLYSQWTQRIRVEFRQQGDMERLRGIPVLPFMDRNSTQPIARFQSGFIEAIVKPLYDVVSKIPCIDIHHAEEFINDNLERWKNVGSKNPSRASESDAEDRAKDSTSDVVLRYHSIRKAAEKFKQGTNLANAETGAELFKHAW